MAYKIYFFDKINCNQTSGKRCTEIKHFWMCFRLTPYVLSLCVKDCVLCSTNYQSKSVMNRTESSKQRSQLCKAVLARSHGFCGDKGDKAENITICTKVSREIKISGRDVLAVNNEADGNLSNLSTITINKNKNRICTLGPWMFCSRYVIKMHLVIVTICWSKWKKINCLTNNWMRRTSGEMRGITDVCDSRLFPWIICSFTTSKWTKKRRWIHPFCLCVKGRNLKKNLNLKGWNIFFQGWTVSFDQSGH